jgi:hypothetical protein
MVASGTKKAMAYALHIDTGFYTAKNIAEAEEMGLKRVSVPNRST